jgi:hypothetical protein
MLSVAWVMSTTVRPFVRHAAQGVHHLLFETGVETGGGFVEEDQFGVGEQFGGDADALALSAGEVRDARPADGSVFIATVSSTASMRRFLSSVTSGWRGVRRAT